MIYLKRIILFPVFLLVGNIALFICLFSVEKSREMAELKYLDWIEDIYA